MNALEELSFLPDCVVPPGDGSETGRVLEAYGACGVRHLVLSHRFCLSHCADPAFLPPLLRAMRGPGMDFRDCHAPYGEAHDYNGDGSGLEDHLRLIALCGELSVRTYTVHLGPLYGNQTAEEALSRAKRMVERLLPRAEDAGLVLCVENIYYPTTTVENLLSLLRAFPSPRFGFCYDSGHANLMTEGVRRGILCDWVRAPWEKSGTAPLCEDFTPLWPYLATCHLHDNPGDSDAHMAPGRAEGTIDWAGLSGRLAAAPRLLTMQTEVHATAYGCAASDIVGAFSRFLP